MQKPDTFPEDVINGHCPSIGSSEAAEGGKNVREFDPPYGVRGEYIGFPDEVEGTMCRAFRYAADRFALNL
jgi:hypothetical protein